MKALSYLIYILLFLLSFCKSKSLEKQTKVYKPDNNISQVDSSQFKKIDYEYVKSKSSLSAAVYDIENIDLEKLKKIDMTFFKKNLVGLKIAGKNWERDTINFDKYEDWYFYDVFYTAKFNLFSIILDDEYCCHTLFFVVCDKKNRIISINLGGLSGSDGRWGGNDIIRKISNNKFKVDSYTTFSEDVQDEYGNDLNLTKQTDTHCTIRYILKKDGVFRADTINSSEKIIPKMP